MSQSSNRLKLVWFLDHDGEFAVLQRPGHQNEQIAVSIIAKILYRMGKAKIIIQIWTIIKRLGG